MIRKTPECIAAMHPIERSAYELEAAIDDAWELGKFSELQAGALRQQLEVGPRCSWLQDNPDFPEILDSINKVIDERKRKIRPRPNRVGYFGVLGLAIGNFDARRAPMDRKGLLTIDQIDTQARKHPNISEDIILNVTVMREVNWLSTPIETPKPISQLDKTDHWQAGAPCAGDGVDPEVFISDDRASAIAAKNICRTCEVKNKCLEDALTNGVKGGIFGGMTERERREIRRRALAESAVRSD